jgi:hypothetical protein
MVLCSGQGRRVRATKNPLRRQRVSTATICGCCRYIRRRRLVEVITAVRLYENEGQCYLIVETIGVSTMRPNVWLGVSHEEVAKLPWVGGVKVVSMIGPLVKDVFAFLKRCPISGS